MRERATRARRVASVCTGAFLLAAAGVLDGRRAATHWMYCAKLARRFPAVRVEPDPIFVCDGPVWTSAGVTAGIDLALALVEEDLGRSVALAVARYLVVFLKRPGGQAQFSAALALQAAEDKFGALHDWINGHLADDLSLSVLADQAGMSERSFSRHYAEATGQTPARAIERLRVEAARRLLSDSRLPVKRIAQRCGFGSEETMRRRFLRLWPSRRKITALGSALRMSPIDAVDGSSTRHGDSAYVVVPATMTFKGHGEQVTQTGAVFTVALRKLAEGWRIAAWAWAKGTPR